MYKMSRNLTLYTKNLDEDFFVNNVYIIVFNVIKRDCKKVEYMPRAKKKKKKREREIVAKSVIQ